MTKRRIINAVLSMITVAVLSLTVLITRPVGLLSDEAGDEDLGVVAYSYDDGKDLEIAVNTCEEGDEDLGVVAY